MSVLSSIPDPNLDRAIEAIRRLYDEDPDRWRATLRDLNAEKARRQRLRRRAA